MNKGPESIFLARDTKVETNVIEQITFNGRMNNENEYVSVNNEIMGENNLSLNNDTAEMYVFNEKLGRIHF